MESKTIRVGRSEPHEQARFDDVDGKLTVYVSRELNHCKELDIVITPVKSHEERLREARLRALDDAAFINDRHEIVRIIERVDAEFAKGEK